MFCPKCGNPDQQPDSYCRRCGIYLPDLSKKSRQQSPEDHIKANLVLNSLTIIAAFTLAILLYVFVAFRDDTHPLIYVTAGFLIAIGAWHIQTLWRTILLRKHFKKKSTIESDVENDNLDDANRLASADMSSIVPASVTELTTRDLAKVEILSQSQQQPD